MNGKQQINEAIFNIMVNIEKFGIIKEYFSWTNLKHSYF